MRSVTLALGGALTLILAGCSKPAERNDEAAASAGPVTAALPSSTAEVVTAEPSAPAVTSQYTRLKDCKLVESGDGEDWSVSRCAGPGGLALKLNYGDAREDLEVLRPGQPGKALGIIGAPFNGFGDTIEWRGSGAGAQFKPTSLIVRNNRSEDPDDSARLTSYLVVIDLAQACVIGIVKPGEGQNEAARAIADRSPRRCS